MVGLVAAVFTSRFVNPKYIAAASVGIFAWFFVDTVQGSADLYVSSGLQGGAGDQWLALVLFLGGLILFCAAGGALGASQGGVGLAIPGLVAIALGVHGFGEGSAFSHLASVTPGSDILQAYGGGADGLAYVLHKILEPVMIGGVYCTQAVARPSALKGVKDSVVLGVLFLLPSALGAALGYFLSYATTYGFALGAGSAIFALLLLFARGVPDFRNGSSMTRTGLAVGVGFTLIYLAALLHS